MKFKIHNCKTTNLMLIFFFNLQNFTLVICLFIFLFKYWQHWYCSTLRFYKGYHNNSSCDLYWFQKQLSRRIPVLHNRSVRFLRFHIRHWTHHGTGSQAEEGMLWLFETWRPGFGIGSTPWQHVFARQFRIRISTRWRKRGKY